MKKSIYLLIIVFSMLFIVSCKKKEYQITFLDFNETEITKLTYKKKDVIKWPEEPSREGYTFVGWDNDLLEVKEDIIVRALYEINVFVVVFKDYDGTILEEKEINYDGTIVDSIVPLREGYQFIGWDRSISNVKADIEVKALYEINKYDVIFKNDKGDVLFKYKIEHGDVVVEPANPDPEIIEEVEWFSNAETYDFSNPVVSDLELIGNYKYIKTELDITLDENIMFSNITFGDKEIAIEFDFKLGFTFGDVVINNGSYDTTEDVLFIYNYNLTKKINLDIISKTFSDLPVIILDTDGVPITSKEDYVDGSFELYNAGEYNKELLDLEIRGRGNSTWEQPKKPLRLKFDKKQSMFGTSYSEKNWVLLADYLDISHIKNYVAYNIAQNFTDPNEGMLFAPIAVNVNVYFNGEYQGVFLFADHKDDKRMGVEMEVDETMTEFPFYLEMDDYAKNLKPDEFFTVLVKGQERHFDIKYPEPKHRLESNPDLQYNYMKTYIEEMEYAVRNLDNYEDYIDVKSFVDFYLIYQLMENPEMYYKSLHMVKRNGEKLRLGPVWDFDWSLGGPITHFEDRDKDYEGYSDKWVGNSTTWWAALIEDDNFNQEVKKSWEQMNGIVTDMIGSLESYKSYINDDVLRELKTWNRYLNTTNPLLTYSGQYDYVIKRLVHRQAWMDETINNM